MTSFVDGMADRDLPLRCSTSTASGCGSSTGATSSGTTATFPDPAGMLRPAQGAGPADLRLDQPVHRPALAAVRRGRASAATCSRGPTATCGSGTSGRPGMGIVDFTNPDARALVRRQAARAARHGRRLLQDRLRRAHPDRRGLVRRLRPGADAQLLHLPLQQDASSSCCASQRGEGEAVRVRPLGHRRRPAVPGALGRRLRVDVRVDGREPARRAVAGAVRLRLLEPRHRRLRGHAPTRRCSSAGSRSACCRRTAGCTAATATACRGCSTRRRSTCCAPFTQLKMRLMPYLLRRGRRGAPRPACR